MRALVLGAAAGGGFPQWNSNAPGCRRARSADPHAKPRTQASVAVSDDGVHWFLLNASPDLKQQIEANPALHPHVGLRSSPIAGVVLTGGDVDAIAGLLTLRERQKLTVYASASVQRILSANSVFDVLAADVVARVTVPTETRFPLVLPDGTESGLYVELFAVPGKVPLYLEGADYAIDTATGDTATGTDHTVGALVTDGRRVLYFVPGCATISPALADRIHGADLLFFDGTLWTDDEMIHAGLGQKTGRRMGHVSVSGPDGVLTKFRDVRVERKILIHINNSNPILLDDSLEHASVEAAGWQVGFDGMEFAL